jgi:thioredoxin reductase
MTSLISAKSLSTAQKVSERRLSRTGSLEDGKDNMFVFDILIVGGGIAGLSAAASIVRQNHTVLVLDSQKYRNAGSYHMHTVATWDHRNPADWRAAARKDLERYGTVSIKYEEDDTFCATSASGRMWKARKIILATGVEDIFPDIFGYAENWITGMWVAQLDWMIAVS